MRFTAAFSICASLSAVACTDNRDRVTRVEVVERIVPAQQARPQQARQQPAPSAGIESPAGQAPEEIARIEPQTDTSALRVEEGDQIRFDEATDTFVGGAGNVGPGADLQNRERVMTDNQATRPTEQVQPIDEDRQVLADPTPAPGQSEPRQPSRVAEPATAQPEAERRMDPNTLPPSEPDRRTFATTPRDDLGPLAADNRSAAETELRSAAEQRTPRVGEQSAAERATAPLPRDNVAALGAQRAALAPNAPTALVPGAPLANPSGPAPGSMSAAAVSGPPATTPGAAGFSPISGGVIAPGAGFPGQGPIGGAPIAGAQNPIVPGGVSNSGALTPRGAATVGGMVSVNRSGKEPQLVVTLRGAGRGVYSVSLREEGCPAQIPTEMLTGEVDTEDRSVSETAPLSSENVGQVRVDDDGEATLSAPLPRNKFQGDVVAVLIREEAEANPPLGDKYGLVGCGLVKLPSKDDRG